MFELTLVGKTSRITRDFTRKKMKLLQQFDNYTYRMGLTRQFRLILQQHRIACNNFPSFNHTAPVNHKQLSQPCKKYTESNR